MFQKTINARGSYLDSIRDGHIHKALDEYIGDRYVRHITGVRDEKVALKNSLHISLRDMKVVIFN